MRAEEGRKYVRASAQVGGRCAVHVSTVMIIMGQMCVDCSFCCFVENQ